MEVGKRLNVDNMIELILNNEEGWMAIETMLVTIMKRKCEYEREKERERERKEGRSERSE